MDLYALQFRSFSSAGRCVVQAGLPIGEWTHVAATFDGAVAKLHVNSGVGATSSAFRFTAAGHTQLTLGKDGRPFKGDLDDVRLYDRALSQNEIRVLAGLEPIPGPSPR